MEHLKNNLEAISLIRTLVDIINCPDQVHAMHKMARQEMSLTLDEKEKADEARTLIAKYDELSADLNEKYNRILELQMDVAEKESAVSKRETIVHAAEESVRIRVANQAEIDKRRLDERKEMDKDKSEFQKYEYETKIMLATQRERLEGDLKSVAAEKQNAEAERKTLQESIEKIRNRI